jgi:hypothetical protein
MNENKKLNRCKEVSQEPQPADNSFQKEKKLSLSKSELSANLFHR